MATPSKEKATATVKAPEVETPEVETPEVETPEVVPAPTVKTYIALKDCFNTQLFKEGETFETDAYLDPSIWKEQ